MRFYLSFWKLFLKFLICPAFLSLSYSKIFVRKSSLIIIPTSLFRWLGGGHLSESTVPVDLYLALSWAAFFFFFFKFFLVFYYYYFVIQFYRPWDFSSPHPSPLPCTEFPYIITIILFFINSHMSMPWASWSCVHSVQVDYRPVCPQVVSHFKPGGIRGCYFEPMDSSVIDSKCGRSHCPAALPRWWCSLEDSHRLGSHCWGRRVFKGARPVIIVH